MTDKIAEIRARHASDANDAAVLRPELSPTWALSGWRAHDDRSYLLAEVERLTRELDEARKESDRMYTECGQLWVEYKKMCEVIKTIGARCVELDDGEAVSAILDITEKFLKKDKS